MTLADQKTVIGVTANDVLTMEQEAQALDLRAAKLRNDLEKTRNLLVDLLSELKDNLPDKQIPALFTTNGILIDTSGNQGYPELHRAPELQELLESEDKPAG